MKKIFPILGLTILISAAIITLAITKEAVKDPVCGMEVDPATATFKVDSPHGAIYFCSQACMDKFNANPAAYIKTKKTDATVEKAAAQGCPCCQDKVKAKATAEEMSGCPVNAECGSEAKTAAAETPAKACTGACGKTQVAALNDFHKLMPALMTKDVAKIKASAADLVTRKEAVMAVKCPDGLCPQGFGAARTAFAQKVDALVAVIKTGDDAAITKAVDEMQVAYESLDQMVR